MDRDIFNEFIHLLPFIPEPTLNGRIEMKNS
jgi:hypothetical protein